MYYQLGRDKKMRLTDKIQSILNVEEKIAKDVLNYIEEENEIDFSEVTPRQLKKTIIDAYSCLMVSA